MAEGSIEAVGRNENMPYEERSKQLFSLAAVCLFVLSMFYLGAVSPVGDTMRSGRSGTPIGSQTISQSPENDGTYAEWNQDSDSYADEWSWDNRNWLFGPRPSFQVFHENGSMLTQDSYAEIGELVTFEVTVPKSVFTGGAVLGRVMVSGYYVSSTPEFSAGFQMTFDAGPYVYEMWYANSHRFNSSEPEGPPKVSFVDFVAEQCSNATLEDKYIINFRVRFTSDTPLGLYGLNLEVQDSTYGWIGSSSYRMGGEFCGIAIGLDADYAWSYSYGGKYTLQKLDTEGDVLYSISRNKDFMMRFNITGDNPEYARLAFRIPNSIPRVVNSTGWHREIVTSTGGWEFDDLLDTYVWNDSVQVAQSVEVYGPYEMIEWVPVGTSQQINVTQLFEYWDYNTSSYVRVIQEVSVWVDRYLFLVYNSSTGLFGLSYGYIYYGYPYSEYVPNTWNREVMVYESLPPEFPVFYELNVPACDARTIGHEFVVDFVGHFTSEMPPTGYECYVEFMDTVMGASDVRYSPDTFGDFARQSEADYQMARKIAIETPITIARLLRADGTEPKGWMFQVDQGDDFMVKGRLQGGASEASDIDGVALTLKAYDGFWSETESWWSHMIYEIVLDMSGTPTLQAFNYTQKYNYTYGPYMDWANANVTGWHYEYDESTNSWEWIYGDYMEWRWMEIDGWHWQQWYFNQLTGKWQTEWVEYRCAETKIASDFCAVSGFTSWTDNGDLYSTFLVNMGYSVPSTSYDWDFDFMNSTWYEDQSSQWGEHEILSWANEWTYSFDYMGDKVYMDPVEEQLAFANTTLSANPLIGTETPYIVIDSVKYPIKTTENYDPSTGNTWETLFFYDHYDPYTGKDYYYYRLENDTRVYVTSTNVKYIYNVTVMPGFSFLTAQYYDFYWFDGTTSWSFWIDLEGNLYQGDHYTYGCDYVYSRELYDIVNVEGKEVLMFVRYGSSGLLNITQWWWESMDNCYYMTDMDGYLYQIVYNTYTCQYEAFIDGMWQVMNYPFYYYEAEYEGSDVLLIGTDTQRFWYYEKDGVKHEMPYPGAFAYDTWYLSTVDIDGGAVPTTKSVRYLDSVYPVYEDSGLYYSVIEGALYQLNSLNMPHSKANGTDIWNPIRIGSRGQVGFFDENLVFSEYEVVNYYSTNIYGWPDYDNIEGYYYADLFNGTRWILNESYVMSLYELDLDGRSLYSTRSYPYSEAVGNLTLYTYTALNGTVYYLDNWVYLPVLNTHVVDVSYGDYKFQFMGESYNISTSGWGPSVYCYRVHNATYSGGQLYLYFEKVKPVYQFFYLTETVTATAAFENVNRQRFTYGYAVQYGLTPIESTVYRNFQTFVIGIPEWGMWGLKNWAINPENGALDLDGNVDGAEDQYFIQQEYSQTNSWNHTWDNMYVHVRWEPNATQYGDEMNVFSYLGLNSYTWSYEWNQTFYWYHAADFSELGAVEMQEVKDTILTPEGDARPGYWDIAWMAKNVTWEDILAQALANGWDWISSNEQTWTWISFSIDQSYGTSYEQADVEHWLNVGLHYEYSGLMIWEDDDCDGLMDVNLNAPADGELTHYLIPDSVDGATFVTPGAAYGNGNAAGSIEVEIDDEVTWGVSFIGINGTVYPFTLGGYWGWYQGAMTGTDLRTFDERPTRISIDEVSFLVHFQGFIEEESLNNYANIKVDNYVGNWDVGVLGGRSNLENRSLALNYFAAVQMYDFAFKANGTITSDESTVSGDTFQLETSSARFAEMIMGGVTYDWSKNTTTPYDVTCQTTPAGTFRMAFESDNGKSATAWSFSSSMYYVSIGFPEWEGYSVYQDPVFVSYVSARGTSGTPTGPSFSGFAINPSVPSSTDTVTVGVDITSMDPINSVDLVYWTGTTSQVTTGMYSVYGTRYQGQIQPFDMGVQVFYKVVVHTTTGDYESGMQSYIVGSGMVTTTATTTHTGTGPTLPLDMLVLVGGVAAVAVVLLLLVSRRRH